LPGVELTHACAQTFRIAGVCRDRVDVGAGVGQPVGELAEPVGTASEQGDAVATLREATSNGFPEAVPGSNQQQVTSIDRAVPCVRVVRVVDRVYLSFRVNRPVQPVDL
jgi:hypothetical protein